MRLPALIFSIFVAVPLAFSLIGRDQGTILLANAREKKLLFLETEHPPEFIPGEILVVFRENPELQTSTGSKNKTKFPSVNETLRKYNAITVSKIGDDIYKVSFPTGVRRDINRHPPKVEDDKTPEILGELKNDQSILTAELDRVVRIAATPDDPGFSNQYALTSISAPTAWDTQAGDASIVIAIIDTGIDSDHPDLDDKLITGYDFVNDDADPEDDHGHGTHVAGIAAAETFNATGIAGVCPNCSLMPVKVLSRSGSGSWSDVISGIYYARDNGAQVINLSLGGSYSSSAVQAAVNSAHAAGILVIAAAGNNSSETPFYPAAYDNAIAVASLTNTDAKSSFSNYGTWVDIAAPGSSIYSTYFNGGYTYMSGTSMASPQVAGVTGLLRSQFPTLDAPTIRCKLETYVDSIDSVNPNYIGKLGSGKTNARAAIESGSGGCPADLGITQMLVTVGGQTRAPFTGEETQIKATVRNSGATTTGDFHYRWYLNEVPGSHEPSLALPGGNSSIFTYNWTAQRGTFTFTIELDSQGEVEESDETNNTSSTSFAVYDPLPQTPVASPPGGTYEVNQSVTLASTYATTIRYTTDGSEPVESSNLYSIPILINVTTTLKAKGYNDTGSSATLTETYTLTNPATPAASPPGGTYRENQTVSLSITSGNATIYYTTSGEDPTQSSTEYAEAISITESLTLKARAFKEGRQSAVMTEDYLIEPFSDVPSSQWAYAYIQYLRNNDIASGYPDGTFEPHDEINRCQLAKFIVKGFLLAENLTGTRFTDVGPENPFFQYVQTLKNRGVVVGYPDGSFGCGDKVTRGQTAKFLVEGARAKDPSKLTNTSDDSDRFVDVGNTHAFEKYIETCFDAGILQGYGEIPNREFRPGDYLTRAQMAKLIYKTAVEQGLR